MEEPQSDPHEEHKLWWDQWWADDYSLEGLQNKIARLYYTRNPSGDGRHLEVRPWTQADSNSRPATLGDLFNFFDDDLVVCPVTGKKYTVLHAPIEWQDGTLVEISEFQLKRASDLLQSLVQRSSVARSDKTIEHIEFSEDSIPALLSGIVLRRGIKIPSLASGSVFVEMDRCFVASDMHEIFDAAAFIICHNSLFSSSLSLFKKDRIASVRFIATRFLNSVDICDVKSTGDIIFESCLFRSVIRLRNTHISGLFSLSGGVSTLSGRYNSDGPIHQDPQKDYCEYADQEFLLTDDSQVLLRNCEFGSAQFNRARFDDGFRMTACKVIGTCNFGQELDEEIQSAAHFSGVFAIDRSEIGGLFSVDSCEFESSIVVSEMLFRGIAIFSGTRLSVSETEYNVHAIRYSRNRFENSFVFDLCDLQDLLMFSGSDFASGVTLEVYSPQLFEKSVNIVRRTKEVELRRDLAERFEICAMKVRQLLQEKNDQHMMVWLHRLQWRMSGVRSGWSVERFVSVVYDRMFGFGIDFLAPSFTWVGTVIVFALIYGSFGVPHAVVSGEGGITWLAESALAHSLDVMFLGRSDQPATWVLGDVSLVELLPINPDGEGGLRWILVRIIEAVQLLISGVSIFCVALAARRRFQVG